MEGRLFEDLVVSRPAGNEARTGGIPFSLVAHAVVLAGLALLSVAASDDLPTTTHGRIPDFPPVVVHAAPGPVGPTRRAAPRRAAPTRRLEIAPSVEPAVEETPFEDLIPVEGDPGPAVECVGCSPAGGGGGGNDPTVLIGIGTEVAVEPAPRRVGGLIQPPRKIRHVDPVYPELAKRAGVTGVVVLDCVIDPAGLIRSVQVMSGHPLLNEAAVSAVRQWAYRPTLLNGVPVAVVMTVTVRFSTR